VLVVKGKSLPVSRNVPIFSVLPVTIPTELCCYPMEYDVLHNTKQGNVEACKWCRNIGTTEKFEIFRLHHLAQLKETLYMSSCSETCVFVQRYLAV